MLVPQLTRPPSQFNAEQSNEMARCQASSPVSLSGNDIGRCPAIILNLILSSESTPMKDVGTTVNKTTIPVKCWAINRNGETSPLPPVSVSHNNIGRCQAINLNIVCQKSQHLQRMSVPQSTGPQSQYNDEQSNEKARCHPSPPFSVSRNDIGRCPVINLNLVLSKESTPVKDVGMIPVQC